MIGVDIAAQQKICAYVEWTTAIRGRRRDCALPIQGRQGYAPPTRSSVAYLLRLPRPNRNKRIGRGPMTQRLSRRTFAVASVAALAAPALVRSALAADEPLRLRCSLDTAPSHLRNVSMRDYLGKVEAAAGGKIKTEMFESGQLYPDLEVGKALIQGQVEMAAPGSWTITGIVSDADCFQLPVLYGQPIDLIHRVIDGKPGQYLNAQIQQKLRSHVLGPYLDLGFQNWYSANKPVASLADLKGMKIRNSGGAGQAWRARFLGAIPNTTAWPNVPLALSQGTFDGLVSSNESLVSAKLWDAGVKFALEDHQFTAEYIPLLSQAFWTKLSPDLQKLMTDIWAQNIPAYRDNMAAAQTKARATLEAHGVKFTNPTAEQTAEARKLMMAEQEQLAKDIKVAPEMVKLIMAEVGSGS
jgi:TRAP-type C4-dicarboxylate transport system substrate-binding protein